MARATCPPPDSVAAWANANGVNVMAAEGLHGKLRRLFNKPYIVDKPAADTRQADHQVARKRAARGALVRRFRERPGLPAGLQPADPRIREAWERKTNAVPHARQGGAAPAGDRGGGGPQAAQPRDGRADHLQHHRPRAAQVLRHPAGRSTSARRRSTTRSCRSWARASPAGWATRTTSMPCSRAGRAGSPARHAGAPAAEGGSAAAGLGRADAAAGQVAPLRREVLEGAAGREEEPRGRV